jgi:hypothetical protein
MKVLNLDMYEFDTLDTNNSLVKKLVYLFFAVVQK